MLYLDSNVFVYAAINQGRTGDRARLLLREVQQGKMHVASSTLTFDELVWAVKRYRSFEDALVVGKAFLNMSGLRLVNVDGDMLGLALDIMEKYRMDPRDSIHAASAISENAEFIISTDEHFDMVKETRRRKI